MSNNDLLFNGNNLRTMIQTFEDKIRKEVEDWEPNKILAASEPDLVAYLVQQYTLDPPQLFPDEIYIESYGEIKIDVSSRPEYGVLDRNIPHYVPGSCVTVAIPFDGDANLFSYQASTFNHNQLHGRVSESAVLIPLNHLTPDLDDQNRQEIASAVQRIEKCLKWIKNDCDEWNRRVQDIAEQNVRGRKQRLLEQANMVRSLGLPMKRCPDSAMTILVPLVRKKRPIELPRTPKEAFSPDPALLDEEYDFILTIIDRLSKTIERSPSTFVPMEEVQIRDLILVSLNGHYEGDATGETFNAEGKTDILIRVESKNAFIAECKFWTGPKSLHTAIDQILGYLTWRDTKAALLVFSKNVEFTKVLSKVVTTVPMHANFKREIQKISDTHVRYLFKQKNDPDRDLYLAVMVFNIPRSVQTLTSKCSDKGEPGNMIPPPVGEKGG